MEVALPLPSEKRRKRNAAEEARMEKQVPGFHLLQYSEIFLVGLKKSPRTYSQEVARAKLPRLKKG
jgi:hypothetical protein